MCPVHAYLLLGRNDEAKMCLETRIYFVPGQSLLSLAWPINKRFHNQRCLCLQGIGYNLGIGNYNTDHLRQDHKIHNLMI